jgi:hypothetical protein
MECTATETTSVTAEVDPQRVTKQRSAARADNEVTSMMIGWVLRRYLTHLKRGQPTGVKLQRLARETSRRSNKAVRV